MSVRALTCQDQFLVIFNIAKPRFIVNMDGVHPTPGNPESSHTAPYGVLSGAENSLFPHHYMLANKDTLEPLFFCTQSHMLDRMDSIEVIAKHDEDRSAIEAADDQVVVSNSIISHEKLLT